MLRRGSETPRKGRTIVGSLLRSTLLVNGHEVPSGVAGEEEFPVKAFGALTPLETAPGPKPLCGAGAAWGTGGLDVLLDIMRSRCFLSHGLLRLLAGA